MTPKRQARLWNQVSQRELENLWNQVKKKKKEPESFWNKVEVNKKEEENERARELLETSGSKGKKKRKEERMRSFWKVEVKKKKKERMSTMVYVCGGQNARKEKKNVRMKERQRIRNHNLKILPQYFHNIFTINFK